MFLQPSSCLSCPPTPTPLTPTASAKTKQKAGGPSQVV